LSVMAILSPQMKRPRISFRKLQKAAKAHRICGSKSHRSNDQLLVNGLIGEAGTSESMRQADIFDRIRKSESKTEPRA
jgi:hypothetical protein